MNHHSDSTLRDRANPQANTAKPHDTLRGKRLLGEILRGTAFGGAAFLLGSCSLFLGTVPLGIALLSASSAYTWYILAGLLLSAFLESSMLSGWAWLGVYLFCLILRLCIRFFVDPPALPDGRPCRGRTYLLLCWVSFKRNLGLIPAAQESAGDITTDYYEGSDRPRTSVADKRPPADNRSPEIRLFAEHPFLRMLTAAVCGFMAGLFRMFNGGFRVYDLFALLLLIILAPIATFALVSCFGRAGLTLLFSTTPLRESPAATPTPRGSTLSERDGGAGRLVNRFHALPLVSVAFLLTMSVLAARPFAVALGTPYLTIEFALLLGLTLSLLASARLGVVPGVAVAVMCGLAADPQLSPILILCAGTYALLRYLSPRVGVIGGCTVGALWCAAVEGVAALVLHLPAILLTVPVYLVIEKLWEALPAAGERAHADRELETFTAAVTAALTAETRAEAQRARLKALSEAFGSLSQRFFDLSSQLKRPRMLDLRRICDESFGKQCAHCRERDVCWGAEYDRTLEVQARLAAQLHTGGKANVDALPDSLKDFCPHIGTIVEDINARCARMTEALLKSEKTEVVAADYAAMAALLNDALEEDRLSSESIDCNREAADRIYDYLTDEGVTVQGVVVCGKRDNQRQRVIVRGVGLNTTREGAADMRARIEKICGSRLTLPTFESDSEGNTNSTVMTLYSEARLHPLYAGSTVPAGTEANEPLPPPLTHNTPEGGYDPPAVCGDHIALFKTNNAYFYALISDGMGSGEDASLTSDICAMFLEKMLAAGNRVDISLRMLDGYIRSKNAGTGDECTATVDLMELDLMDGQAVFAKNGAAPTYVVRDGTVYKLRSRTMPIGILQNTPPTLLRFRMHPGDVVVMVSDGVTLGNDECPWLIDLLSSPMPANMDALRTDIIRRALTAGSEDDLSAIAIRVEENRG